MNVFLIFLEVVVKILISLITGVGVGLLVFGFFLKEAGVTDFSGLGPPPVETMIGAGTGLLAVALMLLILFVSPFGRRRWFVWQEKTDDAEAK